MATLSLASCHPELIFVSFAVIMPVIWSTLMPGRLGIMILWLEPEFWLQIVMFTRIDKLAGHQVAAEIAQDPNEERGES